MGNCATSFGAFLDSTVDRYSNFFVFDGVALHFAKTDQYGWFFIVMGIIMGAFVTSYAKARAESLIKRCNIGLFERAERIISLAIGSLFAILLPAILWVLFIGTNATAIHRILYTRKSLLSSEKRN